MTPSGSRACRRGGPLSTDGPLEQSNAARPCHTTATRTSLEPVPRRLSCCCVSIYDTAAAGGACQAWKMLGYFKPMIWTAKMYRTFRQLPTFAEVLCCPFFQENTAIVTSGVCFGEEKIKNTHFRKHY